MPGPDPLQVADEGRLPGARLAHRRLPPAPVPAERIPEGERSGRGTMPGHGGGAYGRLGPEGDAGGRCRHRAHPGGGRG